MPRSEEAAAWTYAVYNAVREVPYGKVTSYGHIARLLGKPECPRGANGASQQATALEAEGVQVTRGSLGEYSVDFATYGWFPDILPSDLSDEDDEE
ncbi:hypothetical protein D6D17_06592 [Aureobasidium pullulans]|uniref:Methylated-DNA-[protein]-cysteine S-methyltransferase DNA binding domain-containing protein n=1 Tax=Aureobasidium pullulans TaxID=5580 RepID=A0A4S9QWD9_AURPU|nr:hypothetical protein JADG_001542 [Aureobasidium pullulans]THV77067.1 hypothetical protein D6D28_00605 [Aureobasidium pullulans]THW99107.1 hypothetical protein D6D17_06592 [Aureobasidium pullulans]THX32342.1 hypothetical protein D6D12_02238 [Aureobasidium pullulans]THX46890.1 hypothetical protein D6D11_06665 [Aureobasidium pullulans]